MALVLHFSDMLHLSGGPSSFLDIDLQAVDSHPWKTAWEKSFSEQQLFNQMVADGLKAVLRIWGWITLDIVLYQDKAAIFRAGALE